MRNPERIKKICDELANQWERYPDFRFWQLIMNVAGQFKSDPWYVEDNEGIAVFKKFMDEFLGETGTSVENREE